METISELEYCQELERHITPNLVPEPNPNQLHESFAARSARSLGMQEQLFAITHVNLILRAYGLSTEVLTRARARAMAETINLLHMHRSCVIGAWMIEMGERNNNFGKPETSSCVPGSHSRGVTKEDLEEMEKKIMKNLDDVLADVEEEKTLVAGVGALVVSLKQQVADALAGTTLPPAVQAKVDAVFAGVESNKAALATALAANVPTIPPQPPADGTGGT